MSPFAQGRLFLAAALALNAGLLNPTLAAELAPSSGRYGDLLLARDPDTGVLTGFESASEVGAGTDKAPQFTCRFAIRGQPAGPGKYDILAWLPGPQAAAEGAPLKGKLTTTESGVTLTLAATPGGSQYRFVEGVSDYDRDKTEDWRSIAVVASAKTYFNAKPNDRGGLKSFLLRNDAVGVRQVRGGWLEVEYVSEKSVTRGWIAARDFYPDQPSK